MSIRKFASIAFLEAHMAGDGFAKSAHRAVFNYTPREGYLYVRSRAISSRCNDNFDMFPAEEIEKSYLTFIGKPVFVNHHNEDHRRSRGVIIDAALHKDRNPDGSPDTWAEVLMEVDAVRFPRLAKAILAGEVDRTSMGCDVQLSKCSVCGNEATSPLQYCAHIPGKKGKKIYKIDPRTGAKSAQLVFEICSGLSFFENSLLVEAPADPTAFFLGNVEVGPGLEHLTAGMNKTASRKYRTDRNGETRWTNYCEAPGCKKSISDRNYDDSLSWTTELDNNEEHHEFCSDAHALAHMNKHPEMWDKTGDDYNNPGQNTIHDYYRKHGSLHPYAWNPDGRTTPYTLQEGAEYQVENFPYTMFMHDAKPLNVWSLLKQAATEPFNPAWYQESTPMPVSQKVINLVHEAQRTDDDLYDWDFLAARANHPEAHLAGQQHWHAMAPIVGNRPGMKDSDVEWFKKHPASSDNIIDHYHQATDQEKDEGARWYSEVGHGGQVLAKAHNPHLSDTEARHQGAGVISAFSPQSEFHSNMLNSMTTFHHGSAPSSRRVKSSASPADAEAHQAMEMNAVNADKIVKGAHPLDVLGGHKTHAFYHNLAHGGQESPDSGCSCPNDHVTVDAHALSVACGKRIRAKEHGNPDLSDYHTYHHVADMYREATHHISQQEGRQIHPSEVQAVTWLVRQRLNGDKAQTTKSNNTKKVLHERLKSNGFEPEEIMGGSKSNHQQKSSRRYVAYGETKSPEDVDTLRSENCTVCGNSSAWDGTQCQVCGYTAPPRPFGDPNTDIAQQKDIRKQVLDGNEADPNDPDQQLGQQLGDPGELQDQQDAAAAGEDTQMGTLTCNVCGTGVQPAPPTSESGGEPPYPADGDVCPICQKGQLLSGAEEGGAPMGDEAEMDSADAEEGQEGNAPGGASQQELEEDDGDQDANDEEEGRSDASDDDDQDDGDSFDPKQKAEKNQKKSAFVPVWWKPVWWRA